MTLRPDCLTCYDTAFYHGEAQNADPAKYEGSRLIYPSILCTCPAAVEWLGDGTQGWRRNGEFKLGQWDGWCHSIHPTHFTWYAKAGIWVELDFGIIDDIQYMWKLGLDTLFSCEGEPQASTRYIKFANAEDARVASERLKWVERVDEVHNAVYARR